MGIERFCMDVLLDFIKRNHDEIKRDYDEASFLYPFWQNYPPDKRGRQPKGDQYPWIEVGEQVLCPKIARYLDDRFQVTDTGLPSGPDDRHIISGRQLHEYPDYPRAVAPAFSARHRFFYSGRWAVFAWR